MNWTVGLWKGGKNIPGNLSGGGFVMPIRGNGPLRRGVGRGNVPGKRTVCAIFGTARGRLKIFGRHRRIPP